MSRKTIIDMSAWPSLSLEGNLIAPAMIAKIDQRQAPEQSPEDYSVRKGLQIREEIATAFRVGQSHFDAFIKIEHPSPAATVRFISGFFKETFDYTDLTAVPAPIALMASGRVPIVVVPPHEQLDRRSPTLSTDRSRSPAFALQDYLNDRDDALWGIVTNGTQLRLMRDNASLTRPAYIEADLAQMFTNEDIASFAALWLLIHRSRFGAADAPATDCALERWRDAGSKEGEAARDRLADQVQLALKLLGSGFLEANPDLAAKLHSGEVNLTEWFNELLRLVYRLIFLMVAEDRNLLHPDKAKPEARSLYADGYSLQSLRKQCYRAATWDKHHDRYEGVKVVFRALTSGQPALALPALGGLFAEDRLPHLETARLRNRAFMEALYRLSWLADKNGMVPVNWRAMETEELGSVYESLLELQPQLGDDGKTLVFASEAAEQKGNQRKTTGSYYTPDSLVQALLDTALDPVLDMTEAEAEDPAKALMKLSVIDPACGSGHFLLAAARRIATRLARIRAEGTPSLADFRHALRDVARCCIHGVDRNPMAVELTKVALWIETVDPGLPLGFFDAQIRCGDALLGVFDLKVLQDGIPDAAYKPLTGDDKDTARYYLQANRAATSGQGGFDFGTGLASLPAMKPLALDFSGFRDLPEDTVEQIGAKAERFKELRKEQTFVRAKAAANLYVSAFLLPKVGGAPAGASARTVPTTEELWMTLNQGKMRQAMTDAPKAARAAHAFHWPLEFPDVMQRGGFDVVLGNPPWERIKLQEQEFFGARSPEIANAPNKAARDRLIKALEKAAPGSADRNLFEAFAAAKREAEATSEFVRVPGEEGGRFALTGTGDVNTYQLFAELFANLPGPKGRAGVIVPTGIATDVTTAPFFANIVAERRLSDIIDFENSVPIFPAVHRSFKFSLLTLGRDVKQARFAFFLRSPAGLYDSERSFTLSTRQIETINPNTRNAPVFRSQRDAELTAKLYQQAPVLLNEGEGVDGNTWNAKFYTRIWHMAEDSEWFRTAKELNDDGFELDMAKWIADKHEGESTLSFSSITGDDSGASTVKSSKYPVYVPLYEAKMIHQYDHRWSTYELDGASTVDLSKEQKSTPSYEPLPRYWVPEAEVVRRLANKGWEKNWLIGWRKIARATDERTLISSLIPRGAAGDSLPLMLPQQEPELVAGFVANLSAIVLDFIARQKLGGTNLTFQFLFQLPVLPPSFYTAHRLAFVAPRALELTYTSHGLTPFARDLGYDGPPFAWNEDRRALLRAELDAFFARAYGLTRDELRYILDPADVKGPDYPSETFRVLKEKEIRQHGEYRTRRLVLEAWDRMEHEGTFDVLGMADATSAAVQPIQLPQLKQFSNAVWAWPQGINERDRARAQLRALVGILPEPSDARRVRLAALACLQPGLLDGFLSEADGREWQRLMAHPTRVTQLVPPTNAAWGAAFGDLVSSAVLDVSTDGTRWGAGKRLDRSTLNPNDPAIGRALFAWSRLEGINLDQELAQVPAVILPFIREGRLAA
ncbi:Eco57I restriction-modification methylase domain-containing protein [Ensifer sp. LC163]|uniref:Eco57I restriction-modification methylase domain-containing protein n=1 Tax=Ensifer sp. LC163 TaxID=1120652 RepID=UPI0008136651|nr:N-6 DNA methylase [Ensifer sp. LC163]OCP37073.1 restriction endonuclease [Ensifer sp. LC163]